MDKPDTSIPTPLPALTSITEDEMMRLIMEAWSPDKGMPADYWTLATTLERALADRFFRIGFIAGFEHRGKFK